MGYEAQAIKAAVKAIREILKERRRKSEKERELEERRALLSRLVTSLSVYNSHMGKFIRDSYPCTSWVDEERQVGYRDYLVGRDALQNDDPFVCIYAMEAYTRPFPYGGDIRYHAVHDHKKQMMWEFAGRGVGSRGNESGPQPHNGDTCPVCKRKIVIFR